MLKDKGGAVPVIILALVAVIATAVLGATNLTTYDTIQEQLERIASENRMIIFPDAESFTELEVEDAEAHSNIDSVYTADAGGQSIGYVVEAHGKGYGGSLPVMVGIASDGTITGVTILSNSETPGLGTKVEEPDFLDQFLGSELAGKYSTKQIEGGDTDIAAVSGATISSKAVVEAVNHASDYITAFGGGE